MASGEPLIYTADEARKLLKISRGLMYEALRTGQIPSIRLGRRILIPRAALESLLRATAWHHGEGNENLPQP